MGKILNQKLSRITIMLNFISDSIDCICLIAKREDIIVLLPTYLQYEMERHFQQYMASFRYFDPIARIHYNGVNFTFTSPTNDIYVYVPQCSLFKEENNQLCYKLSLN